MDSSCGNGVVAVICFGACSILMVIVALLDNIITYNKPFPRPGVRPRSNLKMSEFVYKSFCYTVDNRQTKDRWIKN